ncbi:MAG: pyridoxal 5'-phosphate synthase glutaminase subunit PdxT, partial [Oscillospiraceae bacterium]|nr:pyridoxal 5'-phosphate synthase glutaminase subunit PdxT [Oscillospiraceae bacterium]
GRQLGSFHTTAKFDRLGEIFMTFIRAPYIESVSTAKILAEVDGKIVAAQEKNQLALAFHPELDNSVAVHEYFLNM